MQRFTSGSSKVTALHTALLASLLLLASPATNFATLMPLPSPSSGVTLGSGTGGLSGTVIAAEDSLFDHFPSFKGLLRSLVVDTGAGYDFYYQLVNTGVDEGFGADIFRMATSSQFAGLTLSVTYASDFTNLNFGIFSGGPVGGAGPYAIGTKPEFLADRDLATTGSVGFDFGSTGLPGDPDNVNPGESSYFAVVRTTMTSFQNGIMAISGNDTGFVPAYVPVPEPGVTALVVAAGVAFVSRRRRVA